MAPRLIPHLHRAANRLGLYVEALDNPKVNQAEAHVLMHLASASEATVGQVHRAFGHKRSTLTSILDRLEQRALVVRATDERDRRTSRVTLTREGRQAARRIGEHLQALESRALQELSPSDVRAFLRVIARFEIEEE